MAAFVNLAADPVLYNILELRMFGLVTQENTLDREWFNIFHYHRTAGGSAPVLQNLVNAFYSAMVATIVPLMNVRVTAANADGRPLDDPLIPPQLSSYGAVVGAVTGDPLSDALAYVADLFTNTRGRSFRGRKHFIGGNESDVDGGDQIKALRLSTWQTTLATALADIDDGGGNVYTPCVLSPTLSNIFGTPPVFTGADVDHATMNAIIGTMRKRKEKVGT